MKNKKILLSAITAGILVSAGLADTGLKWQDDGATWQECGAGGCTKSNPNAGLYNDAGDANGAEVTIDTPHTSRVYGGYSQNNNANENTVILKDGAEANYVYGGKTSAGDSTVNKNIVVIDGAVINNDVYTGEATKEAKDNVVVYKSGSVRGYLYGGNATTSSGNQLLIAGKNLSANDLNYFQEYFFALPTDINPNDTMLTLDYEVAFKDTDKIGVGAQGKLTRLNIGDKVTLINGVSDFDQIKDENKNLKAKDFLSARYKGLTINYDYGFELSQEDNKLNAKLTSYNASANEESKSLSEGSSAAMAGLNEAGSTVAGKATENAVATTNAGIGSGMSVNNFGAIGAGSNRYETGSYVKSKSINLVAGVALGKELNAGKLVVGPFVEFGYSDYETHNDFSSGHVKGDGKSKYYGIGVLTRFDLASYAMGAHQAHPYFEASLRFGRNKNDFSNDAGADYDASANYWGAHLGLGYIIEANTNKFDIYAKYFFTRLNSASTTLKDGSKFSFDAVKSSKMRIGARYSKELELASKVAIAPYIGAAWEKEFSGDSKAKANGMGVEAPSLKGNSAMAEIGVNIGKNKGFQADLGLAGYLGKHRGINGNIILKYEF